MIVQLLMLAVTLLGFGYALQSFVYAPFSAKGIAEGFKDIAPERPGWCLVAENTVGRFCMQVPKESQCTPDRLYGTQEACEMVDASALPLGISHNGGQYHLPFLTPRRRTNTTF